jgi:hypothetical protein
MISHIRIDLGVTLKWKIFLDGLDCITTRFCLESKFISKKSNLHLENLFFGILLSLTRVGQLILFRQKVGDVIREKKVAEQVFITCFHMTRDLFHQHFMPMLFCTKVLRKAFLCLKWRLHFLLAQGNWRNCAHKMLVQLTQGVSPKFAGKP